MDDDAPRWHPQLLAREATPARWDMLDARGQVGGTIELLHTEDGPRYRVDYRGQLLGWVGSLRVATERLHRAIFSEGVPRSGINGR